MPNRPTHHLSWTSEQGKFLLEKLLAMRARNMSLTRIAQELHLTYRQVCAQVYKRRLAPLKPGRKPGHSGESVREYGYSRSPFGRTNRT